jgi:EAL domain-containing protein (putative c-di-GMP-specific phosphodiesterase class I)
VSLREGAGVGATGLEVLQSALDAMPGYVAVLDADAVIVAANRDWHATATAAGLRVVGMAYAEVAGAVSDGDPAIALAVHSAILAAIEGELEPVEFDYATHVDQVTRWFSVTIGAFRHGAAGGAMVSHRPLPGRGGAPDRPGRGEVHTLRCQARIKRALREDRFELHAQPIVDATSGETVSHELLIRMRDSDGGLIMPADFLPVAERCGLIQEIDRVVIRKGLQFAGAGHAVNLNVSAAALGDPTLLDYVDELLVALHVRPGLVVFEITETALVEDEDSAERFVRGVTARGCGVALDDFGTGYGGFRYLKRLPVGALKIDREFVTHLVDGSADMHVVEAIVRLARGLELETIAEGVEDPAAVARLRGLGVDRVQGFALGRPQPAREVFGG